MGRLDWQCRGGGCESAHRPGGKYCERCEARQLQQRAADDAARASASATKGAQLDVFAAAPVTDGTYTRLPSRPTERDRVVAANPAALGLLPAPSVGVDTSEAASETPGARNPSKRALQALRRIDGGKLVGGAILPGHTCDELEWVLGLSHQTASALLWRLEGSGYLAKTTATRKTRTGSDARVYVLTDKGREYLEANRGHPS
jgi:hypothetical protein